MKGDVRKYNNFLLFRAKERSTDFVKSMCHSVIIS